MLSPLVGKNDFYLKNSRDFVEILREERVEEDEELRYYDIMALLSKCTCGQSPGDRQRETPGEKLEKYDSWRSKTTLEVDDVVRLLELCLKCTYLLHIMLPPVFIALTNLIYPS